MTVTAMLMPMSHQLGATTVRLSVFFALMATRSPLRDASKTSQSCVTSISLVGKYSIVGLYH